MYNARNIIVGAAALFFSESDSTTWTGTNNPALPAAVAGTPYATTIEADPTWRHAGYTTEGLELAYEPDWTDIEVDQLLDSAKIFKTSMRASLNTTLVEGQLENLLVAWGQAGTTLREDVNLTTDATGDDRWGDNSAAERDDLIGIAGGGLGDEPVERALVAVGPAPRKVFGTTSVRRERVYYARRCLSVDSVSVAVRRDEATTFPVSFRLLPDPAFKDAEYGFIRDRNLDAAPARTT